MKKIGIALLLGCFVLGLSSCGKKDLPDDTTSQADDTTIQNQALKNKITSLANNIDKMPDGSTVFFAGEATKLTNIDYTKPNDNYYQFNEYQEYHSSTWNWIDLIKEKCIDIKNDALTNIKELGTFVNIGRRVIKLEYDNVNDELHITCTENGTYVYDVRTGYTSDGRIKIRAVEYGVYQVLWSDRKEGSYYSILDYIEDEKCVLLDVFDQYFTRDGVYGHGGTNMLIESNMETHEITHLINNYDFFGDKKRSYIKTEIQSEKDGIKFVSANYVENGKAQLENEIYGTDGRLITKMLADNDSGLVRVPIYGLNGWDHLYKSDEGNGIFLEIGDETYTRDPVWLNKNNYSYLLFGVLGYDYCPYILVGRHNSSISYTEALAILEENYGLTPKADYSEIVEEFSSNSEEIARNRTAFGITDFTSIDVPTFQTLFDKYNKLSFSFKEALEMVDVQGIDKDDQKESYFNLDYLSGSVTGTLALDRESFTINPKDIVITIPKSTLLSKELSYQPALVLSGTTNTIVALGNTSSYDGVNSLVLSFKDEAVDILPYIIDGTYTLELLVGVSSKDEFTRVSSNLSFEHEFEAGTYELEDFVEILQLEDNTYRVTKGRALIVSIEKGIELTIEYSTIDTEVYISEEESVNESLTE